MYAYYELSTVQYTQLAWKESKEMTLTDAVESHLQDKLSSVKVKEIPEKIKMYSLGFPQKKLKYTCITKII